MGRRRMSRRQNPSRASSRTAVNDDFSTDTESGSPVNVARSDTLSLNSMQNSPVRTMNRFSPIEENSSIGHAQPVEPGTCLIADDNEILQQLPHDTASNDTTHHDTTSNRPQTQYRAQNVIEGAGGEPPQSRNLDMAPLNLLLQTLMTRMDQKSETHTRAISECMTRSMSMIRKRCESVKECVKVVADSTQNNFQQLLREIRDTRSERVQTVVSSPSSNYNRPSTASAWTTEERPQRVATRCQEPVAVVSCAASIPSAAHNIQLQSLSSEMQEMRDDRVHATFYLPRCNPSQIPNAVSTERRTVTPVNHSLGLGGFTSLAHRLTTTTTPSTSTFQLSQCGMPMTTAVTDSLLTQPSVIRNGSVIRNVDSYPHLSNRSTVGVQKSATNVLCDKPCAQPHTVRLPAFTGNSADSWKVWHARFTIIADLNQWDETTRLSELMQRFQGTAAEFVLTRYLKRC